MCFVVLRGYASWGCCVVVKLVLTLSIHALVVALVCCGLPVLWDYGPSTWIYDLIPVNLVFPCFGIMDPNTWIYDLIPVNLKIH
ncbi:hypothetical protein RchiOBHm_Chr1g0346921 [Rosa chinensis]|uniref:Uncharacterized protein n=1 Tax=Rosa chinensis TaxID=74649 RepID=A0A2P6SF71_ROSCH|nr:hypothetical protein RchiOBHm_Chr1g0346921 [Rosa chinensis]